MIGVGGAGGNAVNNMIEANLQGVEFVVANTDAQALVRSKAPTQIQLGIAHDLGLGAGANPEVGMEAAKESSDEIKKLLHGATCASSPPAWAAAPEPGPPRSSRASRKNRKSSPSAWSPSRSTSRASAACRWPRSGIVDLRAEVDTLLIIPNQNLFRIANKDTTFADAFGMADKVLYSGVRGITDLMVMPGLINLDFADVRTVMARHGLGDDGRGRGRRREPRAESRQGRNRQPAARRCLDEGRQGVLINITGGYDMTLFEVDEAANEVRREVDVDAHIILGSTFDEEMNGKIRVSVVAAGLQHVRCCLAPVHQPVRELQGRSRTPPS